MIEHSLRIISLTLLLLAHIALLLGLYAFLNIPCFPILGLSRVERVSYSTHRCTSLLWAQDYPKSVQGDVLDFTGPGLHLMELLRLSVTHIM